MSNFGQQIDAVEALTRAKIASRLQDNAVLALISLSRRGSATREEVLADIGQGTAFVADRGLAGLEKSGLASRSRDPQDQRWISWSITDQGRVQAQLFTTAVLAGVSTMPSAPKGTAI